MPLDSCGNEIKAGDTVYATSWGSGGVTLTMTQSPGKVVAVHRKRVTVDFPMYVAPVRIGTEHLRVTKAGDGRVLITPNQVWEARNA